MDRPAYVVLLGVHPRYRRLGLARALLLTAMQRVPEQGATQMVLETEEEDSPAMQLYRSLGFQPGSAWRWWRHKL